MEYHTTGCNYDYHTASPPLQFGQQLPQEYKIHSRPILLCLYQRISRKKHLQHTTTSNFCYHLGFSTEHNTDCGCRYDKRTPGSTPHSLAVVVAIFQNKNIINALVTLF
jgi:hypothetical protein